MLTLDHTDSDSKNVPAVTADSLHRSVVESYSYLKKGRKGGGGGG
jgi:hypothetical protein